MQPKEKKPLNTVSIIALVYTAVVLFGVAVFFIFASCSSGDGTQPDQGLIGQSDNAPSLETPQPTATVQYAYITPQPVQQDTARETQAPVYYSFSITLAGLAAFQSDVTQSLLTDPEYGYQDIFSYISRQIHADRNIVALDNILIDSDKYTDIAAPSGCASALRQAGFDTVVVSNDHVLDYDTEGLLNTVGVLSQEGMTVNGTEAGSGDAISFININGAKIAILSYTEALNNKTSENLPQMTDAVILYDPAKVRSDMQYVREQGALFVIVYIHWGKEEAESVTSTQREMAQTFNQYGADVVIGINQHIVQPIEMISGYNELTGRSQQTLVAYSMGSLITESRENRDHISSYLLNLEVSCSTDSVRFVSISYTPLYIWNDRSNNNNRFYSVCSSEAAPACMSETQQTYMEHSLQFIKNKMENSPAVMSEN